MGKSQIDGCFGGCQQSPLLRFRSTRLFSIHLPTNCLKSVAEGKLKEAENLLQKLSQNSDPIVSFKAKRILAEMLRQRGDFEKAKGLLTSLLSFPAKEPSLRAEQARASLNLAWCFLTQPNPDFQKALSIFEQTASSFSDVKERDEDGSSPSCKAAFNVGLLLLRMGRKEEGISALRSFILRHKDCCYLAMRAREKLEDLGVLPRIGFLPSPMSMFEKSFFMRGKKQSISPLPRPTT